MAGTWTDALETIRRKLEELRDAVDEAFMPQPQPVPVPVRGGGRGGRGQRRPQRRK